MMMCCLLCVNGRHARRFFMIKIEDKTSVSVMKAFDKLRFKSITTDNGSEFADLSLPRKILNYKTLGECFDVELDHIYRRR